MRLASRQVTVRIAYISPRYTPFVGGVETHVSQIATRVAARGHRVEVLTQESDRRLPDTETIDGVAVRRFAVPLPSQNFAFAPALWAYLRRHGAEYDLVHAHSYHTLPALGAAFSNARPLVFTPHYHGTGHSPLRRLLHGPYRHLGARIFARAGRVICVSEAEASLVRQHFPHAAGRVTVIPNGVEAEELRAAEPFDDPRAIILSAGRLEEYKNVQLIVQALAHLEPAFALIITGDGPARPLLEETAARAGVNGRVHLLGRVDAGSLRRWFRTARVYVSMSRHEAFGITLLEGLAAGAGVVASDIPAYREVAASVAPGAVHLVALDASPQALAATIRAVAERTRGGVVSVDVPSWDDVTARTLALYHALLKRES